MHTGWPRNHHKYILQITQPSQYRYAKLQYRFAVISGSPSTSHQIFEVAILMEHLQIQFFSPEIKWSDGIFAKYCKKVFLRIDKYLLNCFKGVIKFTFCINWLSLSLFKFCITSFHFSTTKNFFHSKWRKPSEVVLTIQ